jgi:hypothetical protein
MIQKEKCGCLSLNRSQDSRLIYANISTEFVN